MVSQSENSSESELEDYNLNLLFETPINLLLEELGNFDLLFEEFENIADANAVQTGMTAALTAIFGAAGANIRDLRPVVIKVKEFSGREDEDPHE